MDNIKEMVCAVCGAVGGAISWALGGWDNYIITLVILMGIDLVTGFLVAFVWHNSKKTSSGAVDSREFAKGFCRKIMIAFLVAVACLIDRLLGTDYVRDAVCIGFCVNEIISIAENAGLMGLPMPNVIRKALDVLTDKADGPKE